MAQHDELHPEDVDTKGEDHAIDDLRYMLKSLREGRAPKQENAIEKRMRLQQESETLYNNFNYNRQ